MIKTVKITGDLVNITVFKYTL